MATAATVVEQPALQPYSEQHNEASQLDQHEQLSASNLRQVADTASNNSKPTTRRK